MVRTSLPELQDHLPRLLGHMVHLPSVEQYHVALAVVSFAAFGLLLLSWLTDSASYALVVLQSVMTLNIVVHLAAAAWMRGYVPGLVTAVLVELPTSLVVCRRLRAVNWMTSRQRTLLPLWTLVLHGPGLFGLLAFVRSLR